jgi:hypothetical protein
VGGLWQRFRYRQTYSHESIPFSITSLQFIHRQRVNRFCRYVSKNTAHHGEIDIKTHSPIEYRQEAEDFNS